MFSKKQTLRKTMQDRLAGVTQARRQEASERIAGRIREIPEWQAASVVGLFSGRADEMDTGLLWPLAEGKKCCYPRAEGEDLKFYRVEALADLSPGRWGLLEPVESSEETPDFLLVPGLAFDPAGRRLGRGRGFYDRWLAKYPATVPWGVGFDFQIVPRVPAEAHDVGMQGVITENALYRIR